LLVFLFNVNREIYFFELFYFPISFIVQPIYIGPNINIISTIPNYRTIIRCLFQSYPSPQIQWIKLSRTIQDPEGRILAVVIDNGVNDITIKQIGPILYESVLSVNIFIVFLIS